jgi:S-adenosyl-L-methionine hydrolase (adenosine-forming)
MCLLITLTTDFGRDSAYVAAMKGVILQINRAASIVDISHGISPQNILEGAFVLGEATHWFPPDSIHVAVVDPGVGTERRIVYARIGDQQYVCPDNGLLSYICRNEKPSLAFEVTNRSLFMPQVSNTFHGRDIMAPVAAHLSLGLSADQLGPPAGDMRLLDWPGPTRSENAIVGKILFADSFGNLITNIQVADLPAGVEPESITVETEKHRIIGINQTYEESPPTTPIALFGSSGWLELAVVQGSAAVQLGLQIGENVSLRSRP